VEDLKVEIKSLIMMMMMLSSDISTSSKHPPTHVGPQCPIACNNYFVTSAKRRYFVAVFAVSLSAMDTKEPTCHFVRRFHIFIS